MEKLKKENSFYYVIVTIHLLFCATLFTLLVSFVSSDKEAPRQPITKAELLLGG